MSHKLPLFPNKLEACGDVRPLLAEVFRKAPSAAPFLTAPENDTEVQTLQPIPENPSEIADIKKHEDKVRSEYGEQLAHGARAAACELSYSRPAPAQPLCALAQDAHFGVIPRQDLMPTTLENTDQLRCRWLITKTSSDTSATTNQPENFNLLPDDVVLSPKDISIQSVSSGEAAPRPPRPRRPSRPPLDPPCCVVCEPATLYFANFTVGHEYVQSVRVVNTSQHTVRLALRPPACAALRLSLRTGLARVLALSSGAALYLRVHFTPRDVRALSDEVLVRVSRGAPAAVPLLCYLDPPLLDVIVPRAEVGETWCGLVARLAVAPPRSPLLDLGARLAGAPHRVPLQLACAAHHAAFYLMTEDAWCSLTVDEEAIRTGYVVAGAFSVGPVYWTGGAGVACGGLAVHRAPTPGLRSAALRLLSSTAVVRPLTIVADSIMFNTDHITLQTPGKMYDILLEGDPACPHHVHLGAAFPDRPLAATVHLLNHSAVPYSYYWSVRPWDKVLLSAEKRHSEVFSEVIESDLTSLHTESVSAIRVEPVRGLAGARSVSAVHVCAPRAGADCGLHRLVLMLVLTDIPRESLGPEYDDVILGTTTVEEEEIPGLCKAWTREVCEVLVTQLEVWWEVVPLRFVLHPPVLLLTNTKRVSSVELQVEVTQLHAGGGAGGTRAEWRGDVQPQPPLTPLQAGSSVRHRLRVPLAAVHGEATTNIFQLEAAEGEWRAWCVVTSHCVAPRAALLPACRRLDAAPPAAPLAAELTVCNHTYATLTWRVNIFPWWCLGGARCGLGAKNELCAACPSSCCACGALAPAAGELQHAQSETVTYRCHAPSVEGSVVNIVQLWAGAPGSVEAGRVCGGPARSALLAHRALRPRLLLHALRCGCPHPCQCEEVPASGDASGTGGRAVLRPRRALRPGRSETHLLRCVNLTPVPTAICWETNRQCSDVLKVTFSPAACEIGAFATIVIQVELHAAAASVRRLRVYRATVRHATAPLYLLLDTAVDGRKVSIDIPTGDNVLLVTTVTSSERGAAPWDCEDATSLSPEDIFTHFKRKDTQLKAAGTEAETMAELAADSAAELAKETMGEAAAVTVEETAAEIMEETAAETVGETMVETKGETAAGGSGPCVCYALPVPPRHASLCLQFRHAPVGTVQWRQVVLRNPRELPLRWSAHVRRWPHARALALQQGQCVEKAGADVGVAVQCVPSHGVLRAGDTARLTLGVRVHTWGLYRDQLLLQTELMEPVLLDVWVEAVGAPLQFALRPPGQPAGEPDGPPVMMTRADPERRLVLANNACCDLRVRTLLLKDHECTRDALPLRVYVRLYDVPRHDIPLQDREGYSMSFEKDSSSQCIPEAHISTGIEIIISDDYGRQAETIFEVEPGEFDMPAGGCASPVVRLRVSPAPSAPRAAACLLLLSQPLQRCGEGWYRPDPPPQVAWLRLDERPRLQLSRDCLRAQLSALRLPPGGVTRVRKYLQALNVGEAALALRAVTVAPWRVSVAQAVHGACAAGCGEGSQCLLLDLPPQTSVRLCCELTLHTEAVWPAAGAGEDMEKQGEGEAYASVRADTEVKFYDADEVLQAAVSLRAVVEVPALRASPQHCDFGFVALEDSRKTYFTVSHSSTMCALEAKVQCAGAQFAASPARLSLAPHVSARVYVQYAARHDEAEACGEVCVRAAGAAGRWCCARVTLRAAGTRDRARALPVHDHTDDEHLLPSQIPNIM